MATPRNRKQRRALATASTTENSFDPSSIPLARPPPADSSRSKQKGKTLIEIAAERQKKPPCQSKNGVSTPAVLNLTTEPAETQFLQISASGEVSHFHPEDADSLSAGQPSSHRSEPEVPPLIDTILLSLPLAAVHFTLAFLAAHQYAQEIRVRQLARESVLVAFPTLTFLIHLAHGHIISFGSRRKSQHETPNSTTRNITKALIPTFRTVFFLPLAVYLGGCLVLVTNESPYYAVMKRAPAIGTLWVWCVLEMSVGAALLGVLGPIGWGVLWKGYRFV
ncbi:hypothetical protein V8E54_013296 [Elaphomyces granulatus]